MAPELVNRRWDEDYLMAERQKVLAAWPTGEEARNLTRNIEYNCEQIARYPHKSWASVIKKARESQTTLIEGFLAHTTSADTLASCQYVENACPPDSFMVTGDTPTRKAEWTKAETLLRQAQAQRDRYTVTDAWAFVNEGVQAIRQFTEGISVPARCATAGEGAKLQTEIAIAGGIRSTNISALNDLIEHAKDLPLERRIRDLQYCTRLIAYYGERGVPVIGWTSANLSTWQPPAMKLAVLVLDALIIAEQGVKAWFYQFSSVLHLVQNTALLWAAPGVAQGYLKRFGHTDVDLVPAAATYQCPWPRERDRALGLLAWEVALATLGGAVLIRIRCPDEAIRIPTKEGVTAGLQTARQVQKAIGGQRLQLTDEIAREKDMIEREARAIIDKTLEMGDGDIIKGTVAAIEAGVIDVTFSPWKPMKQRIVVLRDAAGAIRYWDAGSVPVPKDILEYHRARLAEREKLENHPLTEEWVAGDVLAQSR